MRRFAVPLLGALLVCAGMPTTGAAAAAGADGGDCRMACCIKARTGAGIRMPGLAARPSSSSPSAPASCRMGCGRGQQAGFVESLPSLLAAPPRLPTPGGAPFAARRHDPSRICRPFDLPERPPRTA
jgi:hypothetical protein